MLDGIGNLPQIIAIAYLLLELVALIAALEALLSTRTPQGAIAWSLFLIMFPILALPLYLLFGGRKFSGYVSSRRSGNEPLQQLVRRVSATLPPDVIADFDAREKPRQVLTRLASMPFFAGNTSRLLIDGEATFDAIFAAIDAAEHYILLQFYIVRDDQLGYELQQRLARRARAGVRVYCLLDAVGSNNLPDSYLNFLREAGVQCELFRGSSRRGGHPFRVNFRNHRKIVVVDGHSAYVGGHNVGDEYVGRSDDPALRPWRDTHVELCGPAVLGVQLAFVEDWYWMTQQIPPLNTAAARIDGASQRVLVFPSGPADELDTASLLFTELINSSRKRIWIESPYFVPDDSVVSSLQLAALRGVDVRVMQPEKPDNRLVHLARYSYLEQTLPCGIKFFNYQDGFLHQKVVLVDDDIAGIGTANFDNRSFRLNFEITLLFVDPGCVHEVEEMLLRDFTRCREMKLAEISARSAWFRLATRIARLFSPVL